MFKVFHNTSGSSILCVPTCPALICSQLDSSQQVNQGHNGGYCYARQHVIPRPTHAAVPYPPAPHAPSRGVPASENLRRLATIMCSTRVHGFNQFAWNEAQLVDTR